MCDKAYEEQCKAQDAFWASIINKYIDKLEFLEKEKLARQDIINGLEVSLPAVFTFDAHKLAKRNPDATLDTLFTSTPTKPISETIRSFKKPDLKNVSIFDMTDKDINNLNIIKHLVNDEQSLVDNINNLLNKEKDLIKSKKKIERLCRQSQKNPTVHIDPLLLSKFYMKLLNENENLSDELKEIENELEDIRNTENELQESLNNTKSEADSLYEQIQAIDDSEDPNLPKPRKTIQDLKDALKLNSEKLKEEVTNNCLLKCELSKIRRVVSQLEKDVTKKMRKDRAQANKSKAHEGAPADEKNETEIKVHDLTNEE